MYKQCVPGSLSSHLSLQFMRESLGQGLSHIQVYSSTIDNHIRHVCFIGQYQLLLLLYLTTFCSCKIVCNGILSYLMLSCSFHRAGVKQQCSAFTTIKLLLYWLSALRYSVFGLIMHQCASTAGTYDCHFVSLSFCVSVIWVAARSNNCKFWFAHLDSCCQQSSNQQKQILSQQSSSQQMFYTY